VGRPHLDAGALGGDRQRDHSRARAEIDDEARPDLVDRRQRVLDDDLGLRARDQHAPVDVHVEPAEPPAPEHVLQRLAAGAPVDHRTEPCLRQRTRSLLRRCGGRRRDPRGAPLPRRAASATSAQTLEADSRRACSSCTSASEISSSSPASTRSSLYTVTPMRWSVTRFSLKLYVRIFSLRPPPPICPRRASDASASWRSCSSLSSRARNTCIALARFWIWLFSSCIDTTRPVGLWVMRTAESVVLTDWPPGPEDRYTSICRSRSSMAMSSSS